jgi:Na+/proline symporter
VLTDAELAELRYGGRAASALRATKAIYFGTIFNCTVLAMVLWAAKEIAEPFLLWHRWLPEPAFDLARAAVEAIGVAFAREGPELWIRSTDNLISIAALAGLTLLYSTTGGLRAVVRTDRVQFLLMMLATAVYAGFVISRVGGLEAIGPGLQAIAPIGGAGGLRPSEVLAFTPGPARDAGFLVLAVFGLQWLVQMNADGTGYLAQRSMACRSDRDARLAAVVFSVAQVLLRSLLWLPIGVGLLLLFPPELAFSDPGFRAAREASFVRGMAELLPVGALGLMFTAMLAALASTVDSHLNWGASYCWCRAFRQREPSARELVNVARVSNLGILAIALGIMTQLDSIQLAWQVSLLLGAGMGVMLVLRWLWWRVNGWGELACIAASLGLAPLLLATIPGEALRLLLMAGGATLAGIGVSLATGPEDLERLRTFYERARPPGFWGPVASPGRGDARRLYRGLAATAIGAFSLFSLLTGCGAWLLGSPAPAAFPTTGLFALAQIGVGAALIPIWWRLGFGASDGSAVE